MLSVKEYEMKLPAPLVKRR